jgi:seryl-tRNA synthetase
MIDLKLLQKDFDEVKRKLIRKGVEESTLENLRVKNEELKEAKKEYEALQAAQNAMSKEFGVYKREGKDISELKARVDENKIKVAEAIEVQRIRQEALEAVAMAIPNMPDDDVPEGVDENDNIELKKVLTPRAFSFTPKEH